MSPDQQREALKSEFPEASIIHSDADRWWGFLPPVPGCPNRRDFDADTADELRAMLRAALNPRPDPVKEEPWLWL